MGLAERDHALSLAIHQFAKRNGIRNVVSIVFARWIFWVLLLVVAGVVFARSGPIHARALAVTFAFAFSFGILGNLILGKVFVRKRPFITHKFHPLIPTRWLMGSFPSDHAMLSFALAVPLAIEDPVTGIWAVVIAAFIAGSRVAVGVHYVSDVLMGAFVGTAAALLGSWI